MKKKLQILFWATVLSSTWMIAGGDVLPVEEVKPVPVADERPFYVGIGIGSMSLTNHFNGTVPSEPKSVDEEFSTKSIMLQAGYQFNQYLAIEGRYTKNVGDLTYDGTLVRFIGNPIEKHYDDYPGDFTNIAIYLKPSYTFADFTVYALLGYGEVLKTDLPDPQSPGSVDRAEDGFQWGLGAAYAITNEVSVFVDYVNAYDGKGFDRRAQSADIEAELWTLGVTYRF